MYKALWRGELASVGTYGMSREMLSCSEVKEAVSTVIAQSARVCRDLLNNQCSAAPMVTRCAPGVSGGDRIVSVVLAWCPSGTAWSHILVNLDTAGTNNSKEGCQSLCLGSTHRSSHARTESPFFPWIIYPPLIPEIRLCGYVIYPACFAACGVRWYNVDVRSVKRSPASSPPW